MNLIEKIKRKLNLSKTIEYEDDLKTPYSSSGNLFDLVSDSKSADSIKVRQIKNGYDVVLFFSDLEQSHVKYQFRYNADRLLLLRGVFINGDMVIPENSILDFAISAKPLISNERRYWVPIHGRDKNVSTNVKIEVINNGEVFEIKQSFVAVSPKIKKQPMWEHNITHRITIDNPYLEISNTLKFLADTEVGEMYLTMLPANSRRAKCLYLDSGWKFNKIPNDGTTIKINEATTSALYSGGVNSPYVIAAKQAGYNSKGSTITFRKDNISKFYINEFSGIARKGDLFSNTQKIICIKKDLI